jgi:hypothetical protein
MSQMTTVKVPVELRDRLRAFARTCDMTISATLENLLDEHDTRAFWEQVDAAQASASPQERAEAEYYAEVGARLMAENLANHP